MGIHLLAVAKVKLFAAAAAGGHVHTSPVAVLVWPFVLKLPLHGHISKLYADFAASSVLFVFQLSQIVFQPQRNGSRWERALRLFRERVTSTTRRAFPPGASFEPDEASFHHASMLAL